MVRMSSDVNAASAMPRAWKAKAPVIHFGRERAGITSEMREALSGYSAPTANPCKNRKERQPPHVRRQRRQHRGHREDGDVDLEHPLAADAVRQPPRDEGPGHGAQHGRTDGDRLAPGAQPEVLGDEGPRGAHDE
jgi:hypothetical protein